MGQNCQKYVFVFMIDLNLIPQMSKTITENVQISENVNKMDIGISSTFIQNLVSGRDKS